MHGTMAELENYKTLLAEIELENTKIGELETRASEVQAKVERVDRELTDFEQVRHNLIEEEALGGDTQAAMADLIVNMDRVREQQNHDRELLAAVQRTLASAEQRLTTMKSRLYGQRRGAWAEITEGLKAQRPKGMDAFIQRIWASSGVHGSVGDAMAIIQPPTLPLKEWDGIRREIAKEFGLVE